MNIKIKNTYGLIYKVVKDNNTLSLGGNLSFAVLGFASFLVLTRTMPVEQFGTWVLYVTLATFTDLFRFGLTRSAVVHFSAGSHEDQKQGILSSSLVLNGSITVLCAALMLPAFWLLEPFAVQDGYRLFLLYYPLLAMANLLWNTALSALQAEEKFGEILLVRSIVAGSFLISIGVFAMGGPVSATDIIWINIGANAFGSAYCLIKGQTGTGSLSLVTAPTIAKLYNYGKYSIGTIAGSSLLRSADTFIIGLSAVLGSTGVALYAIPLKLVEVVEIPLRSFCATAFPRMSALNSQKDIDGLKKVFISYTVNISLLIFPLAVAAVLWADSFIWILGGDQFKNSSAELGAIFKIFALYSIMLPLDRLTGVALDSLNLPRLNMQKVMWMVSANIIGDLIAVFVFQSLAMVAWASVGFTLVGIIIGLYSLRKPLGLWANTGARKTKLEALTPKYIDTNTQNTH